MTDPEPLRVAVTGDADLWALTREVASVLSPVPWVLIGGQMVAIIEAEHGRAVGRVTYDVDALVDVRAQATATEDAASRLLEVGFEPERRPEGLVYRFVRNQAVVDLLAPDGLGERASLVTAPPDVTVETVGGSQAISRARPVLVDPGDGEFQVRVPTLAGAILIKARAATSALDARDKHERDLARLLVVVGDPSTIRSELSAKERRYLIPHAARMVAGHAAWRDVAGAADGIAALEIIAEA